MAKHGLCHRSAFLLTLLLAGSIGEGVAAQAPPARKEPSPEAPGGRPGREGLRDDEEMRTAMEQVMLVRLKKVLRLGPEQESRVMPRVQRLLDSRRDFASRRRASVSHLRALLIDETAAASEIENGLRDVREIEERFREQEKALQQDIDRDLSPAQQARMYLFEDQFRRSMQRRLKEARDRRLHGPPPGADAGRRAGGPADDDDDLPDEEP